jgi:hypothetical protein
MDRTAVPARRICRFLLLFAATSAVPVVAQTPPYAIYRDTASAAIPRRDSLPEGAEMPVIKSCDKPSEPVGPILGDGWVSYQVTTRGRVDLETLEVTSTDGISAEGLFSAARRLLANCRYRPAKQAGKSVPVTVSHHIAFTTGNFGGSVQEVLGAASSVEELPSIRRCTDIRARRFRGSLTLSFVIGLDGKVEPDGVELLASSNSRLTKAAQSIAVSCRYTPARSLGEPVRVRVNQRFNFH